MPAIAFVVVFVAMSVVAWGNSEPTPECRTTVKVPKVRARRIIKDEFLNCASARNRSCTSFRRSTGAHSLLHNTGWTTDPVIRQKLRMFKEDCEKLNGVVFGGNDESTRELVYLYKSGLIERESTIGPPPICFPRNCASGLEADLIFGMRLIYHKPHKLLRNFTFNLTSPNGRIQLVYSRENASIPDFFAPATTPEDADRKPPAETSKTAENSTTFLIPMISIALFLLIAFILPCNKIPKQVLDKARQDPSQLLSSALISSKQIAIGKLLGRGSFGAVYEGVYLGKEIAIKVLYSQEEEFSEFEHEVHVLSNLHHPNIVQFIGTSTLPFYGACVLTEFMANGDLKQVLERANTKEINLEWFSSSSFSKQTIAIDIISGLAYLHSLATPILHRDMKSRNILLSQHYVAKIADFGVSRVLSRTSTMTGVGSNLWAAPEVLQSDRYDEKSDIYSFGVVLTELDTQQLPYYDAYRLDRDDNGKKVKLSTMTVAYLVCNERLRPSLSRSCSRVIAQLAKDCMNARPFRRPDAIEVLARLKALSR